MSLPTKQKTWTIAACNRITFSSLNDTMATFLYGVATFLVAHGYAVKGSCDGTTGAMDGVNRWATKANAVTRGAASGNAQSWIALTDASGCNVLIAYQGASDDVARVSFSPAGLFVAAGTPANQPTATDEQVIVTGTTLINATASADRLWSAWVSSDSKMFRVAIARSGVFVGGVWGVELYSSIAVSPAVTNPAVFGWFQGVASLNVITSWNAVYAANSRGGVGKVAVSSVGINITIGGTAESVGAVAIAGITPELQGSGGPIIQSLGLASGTAGARGKLGNRIDAWFSNDTQADGAVTTGKDFILLTGSGSTGQGLLLPWDSSTTPTMS